MKLSYGGITYPFVVNYNGGSGNDLVLEWANSRLVVWGSNAQGQLGDGTLIDAKMPEVAPWSGDLAGKQLRQLRAGLQHCLALTWDGSLVVWGNTNWGSSGSGYATVPTLVPAAGALLGKTVATIAAGDYHNLALCTDGTLAAWGYNGGGQLGNNGSTTLNTPVLVDRSGALAGKEIVRIEAGRSFSVALCADGSVVEWGWLSGGQLSGEFARVPVLMQSRGALVGKTVVKLRAGFNNWLALCSDGTLVAWGSNGSGEFGNGSTGSSDDRYAPVAVTLTGVLAGKTVQDMAWSSGSCLVLSTDGTLVAWGSNSYGQLGNGTKTNSSAPLLVNQTGVLAGKAVAKVFGGQSQVYAQCRDGSLAAWGSNYSGALGNGTTTDSSLPVLVSTANFGPGERFAWNGEPGSAYNPALALSAIPPAPQVATLAANNITDTAATLNGSVQANGSSTAVSFEYGLTNSYGTTLSAVPSPVSGAGSTATSAGLTGLVPGTLYHFRVVATNGIDTARGDDTTFTTTALATLAASRR